MKFKKERNRLTGSFGKKGKAMRLIGSLIGMACIFTILTGPVFAGTLKLRPFSFTPTWVYEDNHGNRTTIRQRPFSFTPTYNWSDNNGNRGTIRKRPFGCANLKLISGMGL